MTAPDRRLGLSVLLGGTSLARIVAAGELDVATAPALAATLRDAAARRRVVLDLSAVTLVDPAALEVVDRAVDTMRGRLSVVPPAEGPGRRVLQGAGVVAWRT